MGQYGILVGMIIGITGPAGAGKDTSANYIADSLSVLHVSGGDILRDMLKRADLEPKKAALGSFGVFVRAFYGADEIPRRVLEIADGQDHVIYSGFRSPSEAEAVKARGGIVVYIDAEDTLRHTRISDRGREGDVVQKAILVSLDKQENNAGDILNEDLASVKAMADEVIVNNGTLEDLHAKLDKFCVSLLL